MSSAPLIAASRLHASGTAVRQRRVKRTDDGSSCLAFGPSVIVKDTTSRRPDRSDLDTCRGEKTRPYDRDTDTAMTRGKYATYTRLATMLPGGFCLSASTSNDTHTRAAGPMPVVEVDLYRCRRRVGGGDDSQHDRIVRESIEQ